MNRRTQVQVLPMTRLLFLLTAGISLAAPSVVTADDQYRPEDPFAAIDGDPIFLGELNLILTERLKARDLNSIGLDVKRATAALLVRRHLALKSLEQQGGDSLRAIVNRQIESLASEAKRRGSSLAQQAKSRLADEESLKADIRWRTAWSEYLKSQLNDKNLRLYFNKEKAKYAGGRWQVSQIFVDVDPQDESSARIAEQRMKELAAGLRSASSLANAFADAARQHSDSGSAGDGGKVGWVQRDGDLPASVMNVVRQTEAGKMGGPVRSPLGLHLVFVHQSEIGKLTFDDLTDQSQLRRDAANALFDALIRRQASAKVVWFIRALQPPPSMNIIPE